MPSSAGDFRLVSAQEVGAGLRYDRLIAALRTAFAAGAEAPKRHHHMVEVPGGPDATLLLMPAWQIGGLLGVKIVSVFPGNGARALPALSSSYLLSDAVTGIPLALMDGDEITGRRTAATAALGADLLSRRDASRLLVVGAGRIAGEVPAAMRAVRPIERVEVWNVRAQGAAALVGRLRADGFDASVATDLDAAVRRADIVSCATLATAPLIRGAWLRPGVHLDLIGSFTPEMREADDESFRRSMIFVDSVAGFAEAGDLMQPLRSGAIASIEACTTLADLCRGKCGREGPADITLFKAVGTAIADLAAASLVYGGLSAEQPVR